MKRALIIGAGAGGRIIASELLSNPRWRFWPVGFLDDDPRKRGRRVEGVPVLGAISSMARTVATENVDTVVIAIPSASPATLSHIAGMAQATRTGVLTMPAIGSILTNREQATTLKPIRTVDVLGRPIVEPDRDSCMSFISGRRVLITGAAGSIGQELARQVWRLGPATLTIVDINESDVFDRHQELLAANAGGDVQPHVASVTDQAHMDALFYTTRPEIVFHAAAYKHVPLMEHQPGEAIRTNVLGTRIVAETSARYGVDRFVLVSTDKAVRPSNVMGASKRVAEMVISDVANRTGLSACCVRFGNVLGSRGSVIPTFERQIRAGGPVTVTDARMRRYFMTIPEAAGLIIQSGAFGERDVICILDMGEDVSILELAERVIELHNLRPHVDIPITFTGIREGEKLAEDLAHDFETARPSPHPKIRMLASGMEPARTNAFAERLRALEQVVERAHPEDIRSSLHVLARWDDHELARDGECAVTGPNGASRSIVDSILLEIERLAEPAAESVYSS